MSGPIGSTAHSPNSSVPAGLRESEASCAASSPIAATQSVIEELLLARLEPLGVPILLDAPIGHAHPNLAIPLGAPATLDASTERAQLSLHIRSG